MFSQTDRVSEADISKIANEISNIFTTAAIETYGMHKNATLESSMCNKNTVERPGKNFI